MQQHYFDLNQQRTQWIALVFLAFLWGSSFILMKRGLESFSSNQVAAMRMFIAFLFFLPISLRHIKKINRNNIFPLLIIGFIGNLIPAFLFTQAQTEVSSSLAGMLNSLVPFFTLLLGVLFFGIKTRWSNILGVAIGLIGAVGIISGGNFSSILSNQSWYGLLIVLATLFYGISTNIIKYKLQGLSGLAISSLAFLLIGPFAGISLFFTDFSTVTESPAYLQNFFYVVLLALFSSFIAVIIFNVLIKYTTAIFGASVTYIIPIFAILWGVADGESLSFFQSASMTVVMLGVYLVNKKIK